MMISNEELVASNPLYQHVIDNDPDARRPIGIQGVPLFELDWEEGTPLVMKPKCRPIKANILEVVEKEFNRLRGYLLFPSNSPVCSNIVIASKATYPFVRICGDYIQINKLFRHGVSLKLKLVSFQLKIRFSTFPHTDLNV